MFSGKFSIVLLHLIVVSSNIVRSQHNSESVDIVCSELGLKNNHFAGTVKACSVDNSSIAVNSLKTKVRSVLHANGTLVVDSNSIEEFILNRSNKLKVLRIQHCPLKHLDQENMKQFGSDLRFAQFWNTKISALEGDLFKFNPNLKYIDFEGNPMKYVDPQVFTGIQKLKHIHIVDFNECGCIEKYWE